jgi:putative alpha-1,2-mannosidase
MNPSERFISNKVSKESSVPLFSPEGVPEDIAALVANQGSREDKVNNLRHLIEKFPTHPSKPAEPENSK